MTIPSIRIEYVDAFGAGVYLLFGIVNLDLWLHRRERRSHLWLASASGGALLVDLTGMVGRDFGAGAPSWTSVLNLVGAAVATASLLSLVVSLGTKAITRGERGFQFALLALPFVAWLGNLKWLEGPFLLGSGVMLVYALFLAYRAGREGDPESRTIAAGLVVLIGCLLLDVMMLLRVVPSVPGIPVAGFTILFLASARALNARFEREHGELVELRRELETRVEERTRDLTDLAARFAESSRTDELTGLPNRRGFLEAAMHELERIRRSSRTCSIVMADIDHFKRINDTAGHAGGDAVLRHVAAALRESIRAQDTVARWGGEEFILLLPETDITGAARAAETVRIAIAERAIAHEGVELRVTASLGVATCAPTDSIDATIAHSDRALYRAKQQGRDRVVLHEPGA